MASPASALTLTWRSQSFQDHTQDFPGYPDVTEGVSEGGPRAAQQVGAGAMKMGALDQNPICAPGPTILVLENNYVCMMESLRRAVWQGQGRTLAP